MLLWPGKRGRAWGAPSRQFPNGWSSSPPRSSPLVEVRHDTRMHVADVVLCRDMIVAPHRIVTVQLAALCLTHEICGLCEADRHHDAFKTSGEAHTELHAPSFLASKP